MTLAPQEIYVESTLSYDRSNDAFIRLNTGRKKGKVVVEEGSS